MQRLRCIRMNGVRRDAWHVRAVGWLAHPEDRHNRQKYPLARRGQRMSIYDVPIAALDGSPDLLGHQRGKVALVVNVASKCGLTPQYEGLERIHERYADRGFTVLGIPCNQFLEQEPGSAGGDPDVLLDDLRRHLPALGEDRGQRRRAPRAVRRADARPPTPRVTAATSAGTSRSSSSRKTARRSPASLRRWSRRPPSSSRRSSRRSTEPSSDVRALTHRREPAFAGVEAAGEAASTRPRVRRQARARPRAAVGSARRASRGVRPGSP